MQQLVPFCLALSINLFNLGCWKSEESIVKMRWKLQNGGREVTETHSIPLAQGKSSCLCGHYKHLRLPSYQKNLQ